MSYSALRAAIEGRFKVSWTYTPIAWNNKSFDPNEKKDVGSFEVGGAWVRFAVNTGDSNQVSLESIPLKRVTGAIAVQVFTDTNTGGGLSDIYIDNVQTIFGDQSFNSVICRSTRKIAIGKSGDWYQVNAITPFIYDYQ